eukprot:scaffold363484_cov35-Attheya_sp.AAC.1
MTSEDDMWTYHRTIASIDVNRNSTSLVIMTTTGDSVVWDGDGDNIENITFTLQAGTSWDKPAECQICAATSIVETDEVREGVEAFKRHFELKVCDEGARRLTLGGQCIFCDVRRGGDNRRFQGGDF